MTTPIVEPSPPEAGITARPSEIEIMLTMTMEDYSLINEFLQAKWKQERSTNQPMSRAGAIMAGAIRMLGETRSSPPPQQPSVQPQPVA